MRILGYIWKTLTLFLLLFFLIYVFYDIWAPLKSLASFLETTSYNQDLVYVLFWVSLLLLSYIVMRSLSTKVFVFFVFLVSTSFILFFWNLVLLGGDFLWIFLYSQVDEINRLDPFFEWKFVFVMFLVSSFYFLWSILYFLRQNWEAKGFIWLYVIYIWMLLWLYFGFFIDYDARKIDPIEDSYFLVEHIGVQDGDNLAIGLYDFWNKLEDDKDLFYNIRKEIDPYGTWFDVSKITNLNKNIIYKVGLYQSEFWELSQKKYFKKWEYINYMKGLSLFMRDISFYSALYHMEQWNMDQWLSIVSSHYRVWVSLINGHWEFVDFLVWLTNHAISLSHVEYILDSYSLGNKNLLYLKSFLEEKVDFSTSFENMLKVSFKENIEYTKEYKAYPNIFFDKELYINLEKYIFKSIIEDNTASIKDIWDLSERNFNESYLARSLLFDTDYFEWYREDIKNMVEEREELIKKIEIQIEKNNDKGKRKLLLERFKKK